MDTSGLVVGAWVALRSVTTPTSGPSGYGPVGGFVIIFIGILPAILGLGGGISVWTARRGHILSTDLTERQQRVFQVSAISFAAGMAIALVPGGNLVVVLGLGLLGLGTQIGGAVWALGPRPTSGE